MSSQKAIELPDWPQPDAGTPSPKVVADEMGLLLYYRACTGHHVVVTFGGCDTFTFGAPNDEALNGHPLYGYGLKAYPVHRVNDSEWIREMERRNSVHPRHDKARFLDGRVHYIVTFHDSTFECITIENQFSTTRREVFSTFDEARDRLQTIVNANHE